MRSFDLRSPTQSSPYFIINPTSHPLHCFDYATWLYLTSTDTGFQNEKGVNMSGVKQLQFFSALGVIFLGLVGIVFQSSAVFYVEGLRDVEEGRAAVWGAWACYIITFVGATAYDKIGSATEEELEPIGGQVQMRRVGYNQMVDDQRVL
ncbi:hypothetical protein TrLO_g5431 [Triparma laevis f. longispina]|uniref:Uncharacterized protein n=1 Tax=Triparma laevis f. longispina TaxID=1714387 RepID=A0A9W7DTZ5_9STRA|nr:hypothetical protein TrLO_g5431 [Triparma laevis f. longispina]